jgi:hypothetical protein
MTSKPTISIAGVMRRPGDFINMSRCFDWSGKSLVEGNAPSLHEYLNYLKEKNNDEKFVLALSPNNEWVLIQPLASNVPSEDAIDPIRIQTPTKSYTAACQSASRSPSPSDRAKEATWNLASGKKKKVVPRRDEEDVREENIIYTYRGDNAKDDTKRYRVKAIRISEMNEITTFAMYVENIAKKTETRVYVGNSNLPFAEAVRRNPEFMKFNLDTEEFLDVN